MADGWGEYRGRMTNRVGEAAPARSPARARRSLSRGVAAVVLVGLVHSPLGGAASPAWSAPSTLSGRGLATGPRVAFPSETPSMPAGRGAIVWAYDGLGCGLTSGSPPQGPQTT